MVDVGHKGKTERVAVASGQIHMSSAALKAIKTNAVKKGDVLAAAKIAAIMATKKTPDLIPLCHPIAISGVEVEVVLKSTHVSIQVTVKTVERTGVEMEALTGVSAAALTIYDMLKSIDQRMRIDSIELVEKRGGASGHYIRTASKRKIKS
jgi:cyclic pyranopterin monophosphate synthase